MLTSIFERQRELKSNNSNMVTDPFFLLREAAELSKINAENGLSMKQEENRANYNNLIESFVKPEMQIFLDPYSIEERMKKLKFASKTAPDAKKDPNWFKNMNKGRKDEIKLNHMQWQKNLKVGVSKEDEEQIHREMIPTFIQKQKELQPEYEKIKKVMTELEDLREEYGVQKVKQVKPAMTTSFMPLRGS